MKLQLIIAALCFPLFYTNAQTNAEKYQGFDIKKTSLNVFRAIRNEVTGNASEPEKKAIEALSQGNLSTNDFQAAVNTLTEAQETRSGLYKVGTELTKYGSSVLAGYIDMGGHAGKFLAPAFTQATGLMSDWVMGRVANEHKDQMNNLVSKYFTLIRSTGGNTTAISNEAEFNRVFLVAQSNMNLTGDNYSFFNHQLQKSAFGFLKETRDRIKTLENEMVGKNEQTKLALQAQIDGLRNQIEGSTLTNQAALDDFKNSLRTELDNTLGQMKADAMNKFNEFGASIKALVEKDKEINNTINGVKNRVRNNEKRIRVLEEDMAAAKADIKRHEKDIDYVKRKTSQLDSIQSEHARLIEKNDHQTKIISQYVFEGLTPNQQLNALKKGDFDNIYTVAEKDTLQKVLTEMIEKETFAQTVRNVLNKMELAKEVGQSAVEMLIETGVLKGPDAKIAARTVNDLTNAINVGSGLGKMYAGDYSGIINVMNGISGFSKRGRSTPPQPRNANAAANIQNNESTL